MNMAIGKRIWLGFGTIILLTLVVLFLTNRSVNLSKRIYAEISEIYEPSVKQLNEFGFKLEQSKILINYWAYAENKSEVEEKRNFLRIVNHDIPQIQQSLDSLSRFWNPDQVKLKNKVYSQFEDLKEQYAQIQVWLPDLESYQSNSGFNWFLARDLAEESEDGEIYSRVAKMSDNLNRLMKEQEERQDQELKNMMKSFRDLQFYSTYIGGFLMLAGIIIGLVTARSIVLPLARIRDKLTLMGQGVLPDIEEKITGDEVGEMGAALNNLIEGQERIRNFVNALGSGDFKDDYIPLSPQDELAPDFRKTQEALGENERITELKITQRTKELEQKNKQINEQSKRVITLYQDLRDSIEYAKRLQDSILPTDKSIKEALPESFVYFRPKDIVSGDFYWMEQRGDKVYIAAVDCTGHGVPGAFMSLIGHNSINRAMDEADLDDPGDILRNLNRFATDSLIRDKGATKVRDGMDAALCILDKSSNTLKFAGAMRPLVYFKNHEIHKVKGDRVSIGSEDGRDHTFTSHEIKLSKGDTFYLFSDGYADQFGGKEAGGKKYKVSRFYDHLSRIQEEIMEEQMAALRFDMMSWQGNHEQVDDILIIGGRID